MTAGLRLMIYDRTCRGRGPLLGLSHAWWTGAVLYRGLGRLDAVRGVTCWDEALQFLAEYRPDEPIAQVQYWGHGKWGAPRVCKQVLDVRALCRDHPLRPGLAALRRRLVPGPDALLWFRTCETLGARPGHAFARELADFLGCRVAGHTYIIGHVQSGLHSLAPGCEPDWPEDEGLAAGTAVAPQRALWSSLSAPNTITCLHGTVPAGY